MGKGKEKSAEMRSRIFATVVYPESAPEDWMQRLEGTHIAAMVSPLHCMDTLPTGEQKKEHYHVLWRYAGVKSIAQAPGGCEPDRPALARSRWFPISGGMPGT